MASAMSQPVPMTSPARLQPGSRLQQSQLLLAGWVLPAAWLASTWLSAWPRPSAQPATQPAQVPGRPVPYVTAARPSSPAQLPGEVLPAAAQLHPAAGRPPPAYASSISKPMQGAWEPAEAADCGCMHVVSAPLHTQKLQRCAQASHMRSKQDVRRILRMQLMP